MASILTQSYIWSRVRRSARTCSATSEVPAFKDWHIIPVVDGVLLILRDLSHRWRQ